MTDLTLVFGYIIIGVVFAIILAITTDEDYDNIILMSMFWFFIAFLVAIYAPFWLLTKLLKLARTLSVIVKKKS